MTENPYDQQVRSALADLDDARAESDLFTTGLGWAVFALVACIGLAIGGQAVLSLLPVVHNVGVAMSFIGSLGIVPSLIFGGAWIATKIDDYGDVRRAQRRYDRAVQSQADWTVRHS